MGYRIIRWIISLVIRLITRLEVHGLEFLPESGGYAIASNHIGRLDAVLVYYLLDRQDIIMLVAEKYRNIPLIPWLVKQLNGIWVDRFNADLGALRQALKRLQNGGVLVLAPEGTRSKSGALNHAWPGISYLVAKAGVEIVPVALIGSQDALVASNLRRLKRTQIIIRAGKPFRLESLPQKDKQAVLKIYTDEIMCQIAAILPKEQRGVYGEHPRLRQLLETKDW